LTAKIKLFIQNICLATKSFYMRKNRERIIYMTADCVQWLISIKIKKLKSRSLSNKESCCLFTFC